MALQIANPVVVAKIEALASKTGLTKTAAVEKAVDALLNEPAGRSEAIWERFDAILAQIDQIPETGNYSDPLEWDEFGLPK